MISLLGLSLIEQATALCAEIASLGEMEAVEVINAIKVSLHAVSPMRDEPVDCVLWVKAETVEANDYNPNKVAPPEMRLLETSIKQDGYTQPIVTWLEAERRETVDGFHRGHVGKKSKAIKRRTRGLLPVTTINAGRATRGNRMAATIRHNRARGKHQVQAVSEIIVELKRRNWSDERIGRELGMDADEVLRLAQVSGLAEMFADREFSEAWEVVRDV